MCKLNAKELTRKLNGKWHGNSGLAFCPAHQNTKTPALSIRQGKGDRLLLYCHAGCSFGKIMESLSCGIAPTIESSTRDNSLQIDRNSNFARVIWESSFSIRGTLAEVYLNSRGISNICSDALRFSPACKHSSGVTFPALIAKVEGGEGFAVHRTYLRKDGSAKADVSPNKMMLGRCQRGAVRLSNNENGPLVVAEGIETALSLACGLLQRPMRVWASLSTSGMKTLNLPRSPSKLIIAPDGDIAGTSASFELGQRASRDGWVVEIFAPPSGDDWNDVLIREGARDAQA